jgi:uncharacterized protein
MAVHDQEKIPLFPLGRPLYPGVNMKLRIFEQRYLNLVRNAMATGKPFGIVPIIDGSEVGSTPSFFPWGTLVNIVDFDQQPDGLLGITIQGNSRFRVLDSTVQSDGLVVASVEHCEAVADRPLGADETDLLHLLDDLVKGLQAEELFPDREPTVAELSWRLATLLPLPPSAKMALMREGDGEIRLDIIRECLVGLSASERTLN